MHSSHVTKITFIVLLFLGCPALGQITQEEKTSILYWVQKGNIKIIQADSRKIAITNYNTLTVLGDWVANVTVARDNADYKYYKTDIEKKIQYHTDTIIIGYESFFPRWCPSYDSKKSFDTKNLLLVRDVITDSVFTDATEFQGKVITPSQLNWLRSGRQFIVLGTFSNDDKGNIEKAFGNNTLIRDYHKKLRISEAEKREYDIKEKDSLIKQETERNELRNKQSEKKRDSLWQASQRKYAEIKAGSDEWLKQDKIKQDKLYSNLVNKTYIITTIPKSITLDGKLDEEATRKYYKSYYSHPPLNFYPVLCFMHITEDEGKLKALISIPPSHFAEQVLSDQNGNFYVDTNSMYTRSEIQKNGGELFFNSPNIVRFKKNDCQFFNYLRYNEKGNLLDQIMRSFKTAYAIPKYNMKYIQGDFDKQTVHCTPCDFYKFIPPSNNPLAPNTKAYNAPEEYYWILDRINHNINIGLQTYFVPTISELQWRMGNIMMVELNDFNRYINK